MNGAVLVGGDVQGCHRARSGEHQNHLGAGSLQAEVTPGHRQNGAGHRVIGRTGRVTGVTGSQAERGGSQGSQGHRPNGAGPRHGHGNTVVNQRHLLGTGSLEYIGDDRSRAERDYTLAHGTSDVDNLISVPRHMSRARYVI